MGPQESDLHKCMNGSKSLAKLGLNVVSMGLEQNLMGVMAAIGQIQNELEKVSVCKSVNPADSDKWFTELSEKNGCFGNGVAVYYEIKKAVELGKEGAETTDVLKQVSSAVKKLSDTVEACVPE